LIAGLLQGIIGANPSGIAKHIFGSMPKALGNLITKGIIDVKNLGTRALQAAGSFLGGLWGKLFGGGGGSGVGQWAGVILQALKMLGQPASWLATVERRMNQESGGNASVVNRWDSNWKAGTPSVGLMQVIGPTFQAYAGPFRGVGPFMYGTSINPLANTYAGLNYALHAYGSLSALNRPGGYLHGGYVTEPIMGIGQRSGRHYTMGEAGIETVVPGKFSSEGIEARLEALIRAVERNAEQTGDVLAAVLNGTARRAMYSSAYGVQ
jgi:SLT domain-containing protein